MLRTPCTKWEPTNMRFLSYVGSVVVGAVCAFLFLRWYADKEMNRTMQDIEEETRRLQKMTEEAQAQA